MHRLGILKWYVSVKLHNILIFVYIRMNFNIYINREAEGLTNHRKAPQSTAKHRKALHATLIKHQERFVNTLNCKTVSQSHTTVHSGEWG